MISIFRRRAAAIALEEAVEVGERVEPAAEADVADGLVGLAQQAADVRHPQLQDVLGQALPCNMPEKPAERRSGQPDLSRNVVHPQLLQIVLGHVVLDSSHPFGFGSSRHRSFHISSAKLQKNTYWTRLARPICVVNHNSACLES